MPANSEKSCTGLGRIILQPEITQNSFVIDTFNIYASFLSSAQIQGNFPLRDTSLIWRRFPCSQLSIAIPPHTTLRLYESGHILKADISQPHIHIIFFSI